MMKKIALLFSIICLFTSFAAARKTVRKRLKKTTVQTSENQIPIDSEQKKSSQFNTPVKILEKPRPQFIDGQDCSQGKVVLRVTFLNSGEIGTISIISGLTKGKTESAVEAAKKIKFIPAMKDEKPVTVTKPVEYVFSLYY